jgi:hypothetical protein
MASSGFPVAQPPAVETLWWSTQDIAENMPAEPLLVSFKSACGSDK